MSVSVVLVLDMQSVHENTVSFEPTTTGRLFEDSETAKSRIRKAFECTRIKKSLGDLGILTFPQWKISNLPEFYSEILKLYF